MQTTFYILVDESQKPNEQKKSDTNEYMLDDSTYRSLRINKADIYREMDRYRYRKIDRCVHMCDNG